MRLFTVRATGALDGLSALVCLSAYLWIGGCKHGRSELKSYGRNRLASGPLRYAKAADVYRVHLSMLFVR